MGGNNEVSARFDCHGFSFRTKVRSCKTIAEPDPEPDPDPEYIKPIPAPDPETDDDEYVLV
jgi:hypothetical protein